MVHQKAGDLLFEGPEGLKGCFGSSGILQKVILRCNIMPQKCRSICIIPCLTYTACSSWMAQGNPPTGRDLRLRQALVRRRWETADDWKIFLVLFDLEGDKSDKWWKGAFFYGESRNHCFCTRRGGKADHNCSS